MSDDYGLANAETWVAATFPYVPDRDRPMLVRGVAAILYPHAAVAAIADMADELSDQFPDIGAALDKGAADRLTELAQAERQQT